MLENLKTASQNNGFVPTTISLRLFRRAIYCFSIFSLLALASFAILWSMRPVWHTHILHDGTPANVMLAVQYPDGWQIKEMDGWKSAARLTPIKPSGFSNWWASHVLKLDMTAWEGESIIVTVNDEGKPRDTDKDFINLHKQEQTMVIAALSFGHKFVTTRSINRDGIKGFDIEAHQVLRPVLNKGCTRDLFLYTKRTPKKTEAGRIICYGVQINMAEENYRSFKPTINEIIRRLKLVEDNRVSPSN